MTSKRRWSVCCRRSLREKALGKAEVRQVFHITKAGTIAGCTVVDGKITRKAQVRLVRDSVVVFTGRIASLRRFKEDASEVTNGYECGITIDGYGDVKEKDIIEAFDLETMAATLDAAITDKDKPTGASSRLAGAASS
jgi:translation initiation factor IF-2